MLKTFIILIVSFFLLILGYALLLQLDFLKTANVQYGIFFIWFILTLIVSFCWANKCQKKAFIIGLISSLFFIIIYSLTKGFSYASLIFILGGLTGGTLGRNWKKII